MFLFSSTPHRSQTDAARLIRIERKLDEISKHLGIAVDAEPDPIDPTHWPIEIRQPADEGRTIAAIKAHRVFFGSDLRAAKDAVDGYMRR